MNTSLKNLSHLPVFDWSSQTQTGTNYTGNITYTFDGVDSEVLKTFVNGVLGDYESNQLEPVEHPLVNSGDEVILVNLNNGAEVEGLLEEILSGDDAEYVYVIEGTKYYEPDWTVLENE